MAIDASLAALVDFEKLGQWMDGQGLPGGAIERVSSIAGGTQNILLRFARGGREYVLRRPPRHLRPNSNEALRREGRVLAALAGSAVPHPRFIAGCFDESLMGGFVFYLMEPVDGFNPMTGLPSLHAGDAKVRHAMGLEAADAIAKLARVDHVALDLGGLGRPEGFLERQVGRWLSELESYSRHPGYPGPEIPGLEEVASWLERNRPTLARPGILHGDYHLANVMYAHDGPRLVAVVDWEMCTIGDPLLDLGWLIATWPDADGFAIGPMAPVAALGGWPKPAELAARYAATSGRDVAALDWYVVLASFKLGIVLEGTHARAFAGKAPKATGDLLHAITLALFARAHARVARG
ncbi:MAG TPA: phosphotransferase family protein [Myxococcota bacterium]|nr:phosphotransferase family protein [Myxococcota bacterium]